MSNEEQYFGTWTTNPVGLPCFDLKVDAAGAIDAPFRHLMSTGHLSAVADRWGNVNLFTTEGGFTWLNSPSSSFSRSSLYMMLNHQGELVSLLFSELNEQKKIQIGCGYIRYEGEVKRNGLNLAIEQEVFAAPDRSRMIRGQFILTNRSLEALTVRLEIRSDVVPPGMPRPSKENRQFLAKPGVGVFKKGVAQLGDVFLAAEPQWEATATSIALILFQEVTIESGVSLTIPCAVGYGDGVDKIEPITLLEAQTEWQRTLLPYRVKAPEEWMEVEILWDAGQLLSFCSYDSTTKEYYIALGGYGWEGFGVREVSETAMVLATTNWSLAASSLRFVAKTQLKSGDIPKGYNMKEDRASEDFDSDTELWFVLGCMESVTRTNQFEFLDENCSFWDGTIGTIWEHLRRAFYWVRDVIGRGSHGLILIREGDWNDYLSLMGEKGFGESVMNSGMACRAFATLAEVARRRDDAVFAQEVETYTKELQQAMGRAFDRKWFIRGYSDLGNSVGSYQEDRLFINAQSWAVLGKCGTPEQRKQALSQALEKCHTEIGLTLMSRPYSSPAPGDISWCAIPAGEGENAGIWPQTIYWMVWALAEEGLLAEALNEWICGTLRNHARKFPKVPVGIFNGPDCFSSKWSGQREGYTQRQLLDRASYAPMNPMIAWQGFAMQKIHQAAG